MGEQEAEDGIRLDAEEGADALEEAQAIVDEQAGFQPPPVPDVAGMPFNIFNTVLAIKEAREAELLASKTFNSRKAQGTALEAQISVRQAFLIAQGYKQGAIEGKNADLRKAAEAEFMAGLDDNMLRGMTGQLQSNQDEQLAAADEYEQSKIVRRYWEELFAAQQSVLYHLGAQVINVSVPAD